MNLLYPQFLWLLIPVGILAYLLKPRSLQQVVHLAILALLVLSLSRPQLKEGIAEEKIEGQEILIALDVSFSMRAQDIKPDRYTYAKATIDALLEKSVRDNIMLMAFTTNPLLLSPPTTDHQLIHTALNALEPKNILTKGTSLKRVFNKINKLKKVHREVLLITDGGEENDVDKLLETVEKSDLHLTILALGTTQGTTIPKDDGSMLKDKENNLVISRINPLLKQLADATGGTYLVASGSPEESADAIKKSFSQTAGELHQANKLRKSYTELYTFPLMLAVVLFLMLHTRASRYLLLLFSLAGIQLQAGFFDGIALETAYSQYANKAYNRSKETLLSVETPSLQQRYALAAVEYRLGNFKKARNLFASIRTTSPKLKQKLYYNIANSYVMEGAYDKAKIYYTKALQLGEDSDAVHNLALIAQMQEKARAQLGIAHPKSQNSDSSKSDASEQHAKKKKRKEDQPSSGSGTGGEEEQSDMKEKSQKKRLRLDENVQPQPLGSKVYELINKGYIRETQPW